MSKIIRQIAFIAAAVGFMVAPAAWASHDSLVDVDVVADSGRSYQSYAVDGDGDVRRAYLEAREGEEYSIRVRNRSGERIGVVIAVDGRNIISGGKSHLVSSERMYILGPWEQATYRGWRTGRDRVNRFYFTDAGDSYAEAFGDSSAMGVIAVAAFRERYRPAYRGNDKPDRYAGKSAPSEDSAGKRSATPQQKGSNSARAEAEPGTGFGDERYSPSVRVAFSAERHPASSLFLKYEWRETLCDRGIVDCHHKRNRFWSNAHDDAYGYAPYPPGNRRYATRRY